MGLNELNAACIWKWRIKMEKYESSIETLLKEGSKEYGISLDNFQTENFLRYKEILMEWNEKINLTAIENERDIIIKHFIDSISIIPYIDNKVSRLIDIGTGGGFPGIPLKIAFKNLKVTLLDSLEKRISFLNEVIKLIGLQDINTVHGRAEDYGNNREYRGKFDVSVARAVASLPVLLEYCLPFVKTGGMFIAMKGSSTEEIEGSGKALGVLGGEIEKVHTIVLPFSDAKRNIIVVRKLRQTPTKYPRKAGKPSREPLI